VTASNSLWRFASMSLISSRAGSIRAAAFAQNRLFTADAGIIAYRAGRVSDAPLLIGVPHSAATGPSPFDSSCRICSRRRVAACAADSIAIQYTTPPIVAAIDITSQNASSLPNA